METTCSIAAVIRPVNPSPDAPGGIEEPTGAVGLIGAAEMTMPIGLATNRIQLSGERVRSNATGESMGLPRG